MDDKKLIEYLSLNGYNDEDIVLVLTKEIERKKIERIILDYEEQLIKNGFSRTYALENYRSFLAMQKLAEEKLKQRKVGM